MSVVGRAKCPAFVMKFSVAVYGGTMEPRPLANLPNWLSRRNLEFKELIIMYLRVHLWIFLQRMCCSFDRVKSFSLSWLHSQTLLAWQNAHGSRGLPDTNKQGSFYHEEFLHDSMVKLSSTLLTKFCSRISHYEVALKGATACTEIMAEYTWPILEFFLIFLASKSSSEKGEVQLPRWAENNAGRYTLLSSPVRDDVQVEIWLVILILSRKEISCKANFCA